MTKAMENEMSQQCSAIAFYGIDPAKESLAGFYSSVLQWFQELGCSADKMSVHGPGHSGNTVSFEHANTKLQRTGFDGVTDVSIYSLMPDAKIPVNDYLLAASYSSKNSYASVVARSSLVPLSRSAMLPLACNLVQYLKPVYGIGFTREHRLGPLMYVIGLAQGLDVVGPENEEATSISKWCYIGMVHQVYREGLLRDVYPWNFLTQTQLHRPVSGKSLEQWIGQDRSRGALNPVVENVVLWEVEEPRISQIRRSLQEAGVTFDWRKYQ